MLQFAKLRASQCRFPLWGQAMPPLEHAFVCGNASLKDEVYCAVHKRLCVATIKLERRARPKVKKSAKAFV
jgi:hypothetical protein